MTKTCSRCRAVKPLDAFHRGSAADGRCNYCKSCQSGHGRLRRARARELLVVSSEDRICTKCKVTKPADSFDVSHNPNSNGRAFACKECRAARYRAEKAKNPDYYNRMLRNNRAIKRAKLADIKAERGCCVCGERHPACLEFDHCDPTQKVREVGKMADNACSWESIMAEVAKCDVLCSNCHRKRHYNERTDRRAATA